MNKAHKPSVHHTGGSQMLDAENILLQACASGLAAGVAGAFVDEVVAEVARLPDHEVPLYVIAVGR